MLDYMRERAALLSRPVSAYSKLKKKTFEQNVAEYLKMLVLLSFTAGIVSLFVTVLQSLYFYMNGAQINIFPLINFMLASFVGMIFFYFFVGTVLFFVLSIIIRMFVRIKYVQLLGIMFYAATPILLFGWAPLLVYSLAIWSIFLFIVGLKQIDNKSKKNTYEQRE